jgi:serine/threonine protein kinase
VRDACGDDTELCREVQSLIAYDSRRPGFLNQPALDGAATLLGGGPAAGTLTGHRLGSYALEDLLGSGGMGDVYRAHDLKLGRHVAVKILPAVFALDDDRRARFEREARMLAALNHPHIAAIHGFEERDGVHALILEFVEGQTLARRLESGPLARRQALVVARQIAEALEAAHAKEIVHRDLKPANIVVQDAPRTSDGVVVKVLDFGLAKSVIADPLSPETTSAGVVLGTAPYMSPEQARGHAVDARTDIWALGCLLFEMLTGRNPFSGPTASDTLAAILERQPDWTLLPPGTPGRVVALLKTMLEKDAGKRMSDIGQARGTLAEVLAASSGDEHRPVLPHTRRGRTILVATLAFIFIAVAAGFLINRSRNSGADTPTRLSVFVPGILSPQLSATVSPDGRRLAFVSTGATGKLMLWIRTLDSLDAEVIAGTENAAHPFWSPDGKSLGFLADGKLKRVDATGGSVQTLADAPERSGGSWGRNGQILFVPRAGDLGEHLRRRRADHHGDCAGFCGSHRPLAVLPAGRPALHRLSRQQSSRRTRPVCGFARFA